MKQHGKCFALQLNAETKQDYHSVVLSKHIEDKAYKNCIIAGKSGLWDAVANGCVDTS